MFIVSSPGRSPRPGVDSVGSQQGSAWLVDAFSSVSPQAANIGTVGGPGGLNAKLVNLLGTEFSL